MRNTNKKGFTIVELVVVVAVIAILAAVLIPTFAGIIDRANQSADQQAVANINKLLATNPDKKFNSADEVQAFLMDNGYAGDFSTYFADYTLAWVKDANTVVLVQNNAVVYPTQNKGASYEVIRPLASEDKVTDGSALIGGLTDGKVVIVGDDVTVENGISAEAAGEYAVNLGGNTVSSDDYIGSWVEGGKLVVSNGIIDSSFNGISVYASDKGTVELNNVQVYAPAGTNPIQSYGGTVVLNNVTAAQTGEAEKSWYKSVIQIANVIDQDESGKWYFTGMQSYLTVNGGMFSGDKAIQMSAPGGTVVINDGTFIGTTAAINADYNPTYAGQGAIYSIEINGGNFTGAIKINNANIKCVVNGGTFSVNIEEVANVTIGTGHTVVDNGNGTWTVK